MSQGQEDVPALRIRNPVDDFPAIGLGASGDPAARHTAGQRVLDGTHDNLKAVQGLLGHKLIRTTADVYVDWDVDWLTETLQAVHQAREKSFRTETR
jgi:integrase